MKRVIKKRTGIAKGTSSAVLLSILIHVGLFLLEATRALMLIPDHDYLAGSLLLKNESKL